MSDVLVHHGWTKVMPEQHVYKVEVQRTIYTVVEIEAGDPQEAYEIATLDSTPVPPYEEWSFLDGWDFLVYDEYYEELLFQDDV